MYFFLLLSFVCVAKKERKKERQTGRKRERKKERQTDRLIDSLLFEYGNFISLQKKTKLLYMKAVLKQK